LDGLGFDGGELRIIRTLLQVYGSKRLVL
jgi:hypothetical protein